MSVANTRGKILDAAESLFFNQGIAVTGVDRVAADAGVSVVTLYKHMGSKDGLLTEVLQRRLTQWGRVWQQHVDMRTDPRERLLAIFDAVAAFRRQPNPAQWCSFLATASERARTDDQPQTLVADDTALLLQRLAPLAAAVDPSRAREIVDIIVLLYNGVLASLLRTQPSTAVTIAHAAACRIFDWPDLLRADGYGAGQSDEER